MYPRRRSRILDENPLGFYSVHASSLTKIVIEFWTCNYPKQRERFLGVDEIVAQLSETGRGKRRRRRKGRRKCIRTKESQLVKTK